MKETLENGKHFLILYTSKTIGKSILLLPLRNGVDDSKCLVRAYDVQKQPPRGVHRKSVLKIYSKFTGETLLSKQLY